MTTLRARPLLLALCLLCALPAQAGAQREERMAAGVASAMRDGLNERTLPRMEFVNAEEGRDWLFEMSRRLEARLPDRQSRERLLVSIHYEATRVGLDPQLVLGLIQVESGFKSQAQSGVGARGLMQVMPFWLGAIGSPGHDLFEYRTNLRYGCVILRHYLDIERGNLFRALGRYNGSLGQSSYPNAVQAAWKQWQWNWSPTLRAAATERPARTDRLHQGISNE